MPLSYSRQKKEGAIPCRGFGEVLECPARNHERRCAHRGAFSTSPALAVKFSRFHLSQNDASNAKFKLSIANYSKTSAICWRHSAKNAKGNRNYAPSFVERVCPTSNSFFHSAAKILCGKSRKISMRWACTGDCRLILARLLRATRVCAPPGASAKTPRGSTVRETRHPRHRHSRVRQSAI